MDPALTFREQISYLGLRTFSQITSFSLNIFVSVDCKGAKQKLPLVKCCFHRIFPIFVRKFALFDYSFHMEVEVQ